MNVLLFGATGMIGSGVLTECLEDPGVGAVVAVVRSTTGRTHPKLREVLLPDLFALATRSDELGPVDACLYCLGVSSAGMDADAYRTLTVDLTTAVADVVEGLAPECSFCFVSGQGSGSGRAMWARVKGEAEQAMLARPFDTWVFRPGFVQPVKGETSRTALYRYLYRILGPVSPLIIKAFPGSATTTEILARAMIRAARDGYPKRILENPDINALGA